MHRALHIIGLTALVGVMIATEAEARPGRQNQVPHGNQYGCDVCHTPAGGLNDFGFDSFNYTTNGNVDWSGLAGEDSDRDGYLNGLELGDPDGTWSPGDNAPSGEYSHPGDRMDGLCGNGTLEGEEECELGQLDGASCGSLGLGSGNLSCSDTCRYDPASCDTCGDGAIQGGEECDGADLAGMTCEQLGLGGGTLECTGCSYNTVGCAAPAGETPDTCGDGVRQAGEQCDGADHAGETCESLGFDGGTLGCQVRCTFNTNGCIGGATSSADTLPEPTPPEPGGHPQPGMENEADEAGTKIELDGRACTTSPTPPRRAHAIWLATLLAAALIRRSRSKPTP